MPIDSIQLFTVSFKGVWTGDRPSDDCSQPAKGEEDFLSWGSSPDPQFLCRHGKKGNQHKFLKFLIDPCICAYICTCLTVCCVQYLYYIFIFLHILDIIQKIVNTEPTRMLLLVSPLSYSAVTEHLFDCAAKVMAELGLEAHYLDTNYSKWSCRWILQSSVQTNRTEQCPLHT